MAKMRIAVVQCPSYATVEPPLGLVTIGTWLRSLRHDVTVKDFNIIMHADAPEVHRVTSTLCWESTLRRKLMGLLDPKVSLTSCWDSLGGSLDAGDLLHRIQHDVEQLLSSDPEAVGLSVQVTTVPIALIYAREIRNQGGAAVKLVFGGPACYREQRLLQAWLQAGGLDAVVVGEGEQPSAALFGTVTQAGILSQRSYVPQILHFHEFPPPRIGDLPAPDFAMVPLDLYQEPILPIQTSRGCVGRCNFCEARRSWHHFRQRSPERVVEDIRQMVEQTGRSVFHVTDSLLNGNCHWLKQFCRLIEENQLDIRWFGNARVDSRMSFDLLTEMQRSGCCELRFGVESMSPRVVASLQKGVQVEHTAKAMHDCSASGIHTHTYWMLGCPGETSEDMLASFGFVAEHVHVVDSLIYHRYQPPISEDGQMIGFEPSPLWLSLPLFRGLLRGVYAVLPYEDGRWLDLSKRGLSRSSLAAMRELKLANRRREYARLLLAAVYQGVARFEQEDWLVLRPHDSYLRHLSLAGHRVFLVTSGYDHEVTSFLHRLCAQQPSTVSLGWAGPYDDDGKRSLEQLADICDEHATPWALGAGRSGQESLCEGPSADCRVCLGFMDATGGELEECCSSLFAEFGDLPWQALVSETSGLYQGFLEHFCQVRSLHTQEATLQYHHNPACNRTTNALRAWLTLADGWDTVWDGWQ